MSLAHLRLKKNEDRRIRAGHPWVYSNEIDTTATPLKTFSPGEEVIVQAHDQTPLGSAYVNPRSLISARIFSRAASQRLNQDFFYQQFKMALAARERIFVKPFYRLAFSEADNLPGIVLDRFGHDYVLQINTAGMEKHITNISQALSALDPQLNSILLRNDSQMREHEGLDSYVKAAYGTPPEEVQLEENSTQFIVPTWKGQKTGWFYDHRMNRARMRDYVRDCHVLDVFSYVGGWSVQAAAFGAKHVDCIEVSDLACQFIQRNAELNHIAARVRVLRDDAFAGMKNLLRDGKQYDVIILDPPAFVKRFKDRKEGLLAYQRLNEIALKLLTPGGILFSCSCSMHVSLEDLVQLLQRVAYRTQSSIQILERGHQGPDHPLHIAIPETDYLKAVIIRKFS